MASAPCLSFMTTSRSWGKLRTGERQLTSGIPLVSVSDLANQYYCEHKVDLVRKLGKAETEPMRAGTEAHESLLKETVEVEVEQAWQDIFSSKSTLLREMPLVAKRKDVILLGKADAVIFQLGLPTYLFEYKFSMKILKIISIK